MKLKDLLIGMEYEGNADIEINSVVCDSRKLVSGDVFVCISGYESDGHRYAEQCAANGAAAIVAEKDIDVSCPVIKVKNTRKALAIMCANYYGNPSREFLLVGITGTNGKTTTTYLAKTVFESVGKKVGLIGTNQIMIGDEIYPAAHTTPDSFELHALFRKMAEAKVDVVLMEVSSHALYLDRVYACDFDIGVFTNITQDHLDFHKTMENYLDAKILLFGMCKKGAINIDDEHSAKVLENAKCEALGFGIDGAADIKAENVEMYSDKVTFTTLGEEFEVKIPGRFSVYNALSAISICHLAGIDSADISAGLKKAGGVKGRAQVVDMGTDFTVLIDYAHTPDGIENIIRAARGFAKGRVVILFGCGGDRDNSKRPIMGEIASTLADFCIITSDNPRTENPSEIIDQIICGVKGDSYVVIENRREAIEYAVANGKPGDVVILAGKGHEDYQIIGKEKIHFDEEEILYEIKRGMNS